MGFFLRFFFLSCVKRGCVFLQSERTLWPIEHCHFWHRLVPGAVGGAAAKAAGAVGAAAGRGRFCRGGRGGRRRGVGGGRRLQRRRQESGLQDGGIGRGRRRSCRMMIVMRSPAVLAPPSPSAARGRRRGRHVRQPGVRQHVLGGEPLRRVLPQETPDEAL